MLTTRRALVALVLLAMVAGCGKDGPVAVDRPPRLAVWIEPLPDSVEVGDTLSPTVRVRDAAGGPSGATATLHSSDPTVLQVLGDGRLAARAAGVALLRAMAGDDGDSVEVVIRRVPRSLSLTLRSDTLLTNDTMSVASVRYRDGLGADMGPAAGVRYFSSDTSVVVVDSLTGRMIAWRSGAADVIARVPGAEGRAPVRATYARALTPIADLTQVTSEGGGSVCGRTATGLVFCQGWSDMLGGSSVLVSPPRPVTLQPGAIAVRGGGGVACAALAGSAWCWGYAYYASLIGGASTPTRIPLPDTIGTIVDLAVSRYQDACVVTAAGALWCWDAYARATNPSSEVRVRRIVGDAPIASVSLGGTHGCAVTTSSALWCWATNGGYDPNHELRRTTASATPERITTPAPPRMVVAMDFNTCMLDTGGDVWCWGQNANGELGLGTAAGFGSAYLPPTRVALPGPMAWLGGRHGTMCAIDAGGEMWCWGNIGQAVRRPFRFQPGTKFREATFTFTGMCALSTDGRVLCSRRVG